MRHTRSRYPYKPDGFLEVRLFTVINTFNDYDDDDDDDDDDEEEEE